MVGKFGTQRAKPVGCDVAGGDAVAAAIVIVVVAGVDQAAEVHPQQCSSRLSLKWILCNIKEK